MGFGDRVPKRGSGAAAPEKGKHMRLDKYLKVSRIIKRRTVAKEASEGGRVTINGKVAKPSSEVKEGDVLEIRFGEKMAKFRVLQVAETVRKNDAAFMYELIDGTEDL